MSIEKKFSSLKTYTKGMNVVDVRRKGWNERKIEGKNSHLNIF